MKNTLFILTLALSVSAFAQTQKTVCSDAAAKAANDAFAQVVKPLPVNEGAWIAQVKKSGDVYSYIIETGADDPSCRDCYYAQYYDVVMREKANKTCELISAKKR